MLSLFDTASLERALSLPIDTKLRHLLRERVDHLSTLDRAVAETTYFLVVSPGTSAADVEDELGWTPLVDIDGGRFGTEAYHPFHDFAADRGGWYELIYATSNEAAVVFFMMDDIGTDADLLALALACVAGET